MRNLYKIGVGVPSPDSYDPTLPGNLERIYQAEHGPYVMDPMAVRTLHGTMAAIFKPTVSSSPGVLRAAGEWLEKGKPVVSVMGHQHLFDHLVDAAATYSTPELRPISERNSPLGKIEYVDTATDWHQDEPDVPWSNIQAEIVSYMYRVLDMTPVYRPDDLQKMLKVDRTTDVREQTDAALMSMILERFRQGRGIHAYPEGTRNQADWAKILNIGALVCEIIAKAGQQDIELGLLIGGRSWGVTGADDKKHINKRSPHVHFESFYTGTFDRKEARRLMRSDIQAGTTKSHVAMINRASDMRRVA